MKIALLTIGLVIILLGAWVLCALRLNKELDNEKEKNERDNTGR